MPKRQTQKAKSQQNQSSQVAVTLISVEDKDDERGIHVTFAIKRKGI